MLLTPFDRLPAAMQNQAVRQYHAVLSKKKGALALKRFVDIAASSVALVLASPLLLLLSAAIKIDSKGPVFFRQQRVTRDMRVFRIFKFRTMVADADRRGPLVTVARDDRITRVGGFLRRTRLDEIPQLLNVLAGQMSFVGTRPEVEKYVAQYTDEMLATLLMPAGVTSHASILFKDEAAMLQDAADADAVYVKEILPVKMKHNLDYIAAFSFWEDIKLLFGTVFAVTK